MNDIFSPLVRLRRRITLTEGEQSILLACFGVAFLGGAGIKRGDLVGRPRHGVLSVFVLSVLGDDFGRIWWLCRALYGPSLDGTARFARDYICGLRHCLDQFSWRPCRRHVGVSVLRDNVRPVFAVHDTI